MTDNEFEDIALIICISAMGLALGVMLGLLLFTG